MQVQSCHSSALSFPVASPLVLSKASAPTKSHIHLSSLVCLPLCPETRGSFLSRSIALSAIFGHAKHTFASRPYTFVPLCRNALYQITPLTALLQVSSQMSLNQ